MRVARRPYLAESETHTRSSGADRDATGHAGLIDHQHRRCGPDRPTITRGPVPASAVTACCRFSADRSAVLDSRATTAGVRLFAPGRTHSRLPSQWRAQACIDRWQPPTGARQSTSSSSGSPRPDVPPTLAAAQASISERPTAQSWAGHQGRNISSNSASVIGPALTPVHS